MSLISYLMLSSLLVSYSICDEPRLIDLREGFRHAVVENEVDQFFEEVKDLEQLVSVKKAYQACAFALKARDAWNPFTKLAYIRKYQQLMTKACSHSPDNIEIRFLRFSIEYNLPEWIGMSDHIQTDLQFISNHTMDIKELMLHPAYARYILYFMNETGLCEDQLINQLQLELIKE